MVPSIFGPDFAHTWPIYAIGLIAYLIGSIPFGLLLTKIAGLGDIRNIGSGNIGTTNVLRTGHKGLALTTLFMDLSKGAGATLWAGTYGPDCAWIAGLCVVLGHIFSVWLRFRGGKGVATTFGVIFALSWIVGLAVAAVWLVTVLLLRYSSLGAIIALPLSPATLAVLLETQRNGSLPVWLPGDPSHISLFGLLAALVLARHYTNIRRLVQGKEPRIDLRVP